MSSEDKVCSEESKDCSEESKESEEESYLTLELGQLRFKEAKFTVRGLDCGRVSSHQGFLDNAPVRVVCVASKAPDNEVDLSAENFKIFVASLNRIPNVSKCIGVWELTKKDVLDDGKVKCFVFEESSSMTLDVLLHKHNPTISQLRKLMYDILIVIGQITNMGFCIPKLEQPDILIVELPHDQTADTRYYPKIRGLETWKFIEDESTLLDLNGTYDGKSKSNSQAISYERTKLEMGKIFKKIIKKLNHNKEAELLYNDMMSGSLAKPHGDISSLKHHPYFWEDYKCLDFIEDVNQWLTFQKTAWKDINRRDTSMLYGKKGWHERLSKDVLKIVADGFVRGGMAESKFTKTTGYVGYLIRALRHSYVHLRDSSSSGCRHYVSQSALYTYFSDAFPGLILFVYTFVLTYGDSDAYVLKKYKYFR